MNAKELAKASGLHFNTIYKMIKDGELKYRKVGNRYYVDDIQAERLIRAKEIGVDRVNTKETAKYILNILNNNMHMEDLKLLTSIVEVAQYYKEVVLKIKELNLSVDDERVIPIIHRVLETSPAEEIVTYIKKREETSKVIREINLIEQRYSDYEEENAKTIKQRFEDMSNNQGDKKPYNKYYPPTCSFFNESIEDILEDLENISK